MNNQSQLLVELLHHINENILMDDSTLISDVAIEVDDYTTTLVISHKKKATPKFTPAPNYKSKNEYQKPEHSVEVNENYGSGNE